MYKRQHFGFRFAVFFVFSAYVNSGLKYIARTERPPRELRLAVQEGYAFPSGHAQGSTVFWGLLALRLRKRWAYWGAALLISLVSLSRLYLGVHWPIDIAGGLAAGLILLLIYSRPVSYTHLGLLNTVPEIQDRPGLKNEWPRLRGAIRFENVSFAYNPQEPVLENFNLEIEPGQIVALVLSLIHI